MKNKTLGFFREFYDQERFVRLNTKDPFENGFQKVVLRTIFQK